jgi:hypothetical protein
MLAANGDLMAAAAWGYSRFVQYTLEDAKGKPVKQEGMLAKEDVLQLEGNPAPGTGTLIVALVPVAVNPNTGTFPDTLAFFFTIPPVPQVGEFSLIYQLLSARTKSQDFVNLRVNCVDQEYNDETPTDLHFRENPNAICHR